MRRVVPSVCFLFFFFILCTFPALTWAQATVTLSGYVRAASDQGILPGASVAVPALNTGVTADEKGFYSLPLPAGRHEIVISFIGYQNLTREVNLARTQRISFTLTEAANELGEVVVEGSGTLQQKLQTTQMSLERLTTREAKLLPALFGEVDLLKTLQLKPGVQNGGEGTSGLFVRGGSSDQNLFLLDEAVVYNPSHLFGLFSVFNPDAVQSVDLYKGGFPAQFGGRLSSVVDVKLREGNTQKLGVSGGIGLISSRLTVEGPIVKDKGSFIVSGRRTYFDVFTRPDQPPQCRRPGIQPHSRLLFRRLQRQGQLQARRQRPDIPDRLLRPRRVWLQ